jgi:hypothetical protein
VAEGWKRGANGGSAVGVFVAFLDEVVEREGVLVLSVIWPVV